MASRSAVVPVVIVVLVLVALAVFAPLLARRPNLAWLPALRANPKKSHAMATRVWVNPRSGFYYCRASKFYGKMQPGLFMQQGPAIEKGYRPAEGAFCP